MCNEPRELQAFEDKGNTYKSKPSGIGNVLTAENDYPFGVHLTVQGSENDAYCKFLNLSDADAKALRDWLISIYPLESK